jgi:hypothetical protein
MNNIEEKGEKVFSVSEFVSLINIGLKKSRAKIIGEVCDVDISRSGHVYFYLKDEKDKKYNEWTEWTVQKSRCSPAPTAIWELDPNQIIIASFFDKTILDYKKEYFDPEKDEDKLNINIKIYSNDFRELPENPKWTVLTAYSFRKGNKEWLKNDLGVPYIF